MRSKPIRPHLERIADALPATIHAGADYLCGRIGKALSVSELSEPLERVGVKVSAAGRTLTVAVPDWWSTGDVSGRHDLVEEIARLHGYGNFDVSLFDPSLISRWSARAVCEYCQLFVRQQPC